VEAADGLSLALTREGGVRFNVRVQPRSHASRIEDVRAGALVVRLAAPPVDGAANAELVATLAAALGVPRRDVAIVRGEGARDKCVEVRGLSASAVEQRLGAARRR
jgi:uncharacterized protein (TIGR00251 family)